MLFKVEVKLISTELSRLHILPALNIFCSYKEIVCSLDCLNVTLLLFMVWYYFLILRICDFISWLMRRSLRIYSDIRKGMRETERSSFAQINSLWMNDFLGRPFCSEKYKHVFMIRLTLSQPQTLQLHSQCKLHTFSFDHFWF